MSEVKELPKVKTMKLSSEQLNKLLDEPMFRVGYCGDDKKYIYPEDTTSTKEVRTAYATLIKDNFSLLEVVSSNPYGAHSVKTEDFFIEYSRFPLANFCMLELPSLPDGSISIQNLVGNEFTDETAMGFIQDHKNTIVSHFKANGLSNSCVLYLGSVWLFYRYTPNYGWNHGWNHGSHISMSEVGLGNLGVKQTLIDKDVKKYLEGYITHCRANRDNGIQIDKSVIAIDTLQAVYVFLFGETFQSDKLSSTFFDKPYIDPETKTEVEFI